MSEFSAILKIVGSVVNFFFECSINICCGIILVISAIALWRIPEIQREYIQRNEKWSRFCCTSLYLSTVDIIFVMSTPLIICSPLRWKEIHLLFLKSSTIQPLEYRGYMLMTVGTMFFDLVYIIIGLVSLLSMYQRQSIIYFLVTYLMNYVSPNYLQYHSLMNKITAMIMKTGFSTMIDTIVLLISINILFAPHLWIISYLGWKELWNKEMLPTLVEESVNNTTINNNAAAATNLNGYHIVFVHNNILKRYHSAHVQKYKNIRVHFLAKSLQALIDVLVSPFVAIVCISPIRAGTFWNSIQISRSKYTVYKTYEEICHESSTAFYIFDLEFRDSFHANYDFELRKQCVILGILAITDLFLIPMLVLLYVSRYRYNAIHKVLWPTSNDPPPSLNESKNSSSRNDNIESDVKQDSIIQIDDIMITNNYLNSITNPNPVNVLHETAPEVLRTLRIVQHDASNPNPNIPFDSTLDPAVLSNANTTDSTMLSKPNTTDPIVLSNPNPTDPKVLSSSTFKWWGLNEFILIASQTSFLLLDLFLLWIPLLLLYISAIRWLPVKEVLSRQNVFLDNNLLLYRTMIINLIFILHDICLLLPAVLIFPCFLGCYRIPIIKHILKECPEVRLLLAKTCKLQLISNTLILHSYSWKKSIEFRMKLWKQCFNTVLDLFFIVSGVIVVITIWRAWELYCGYKYLQSIHFKTCDRVREDSHNNSINTNINNSNTNINNNNSCTNGNNSYIINANINDNSSNNNHAEKLKMFIQKFRLLMLHEFGYLIRDIACMLLPGSTVIVTIYRFPQFLSQMLSTIMMPSQCLRTDPLFEIQTCHIEFPERGGPNINFSCKYLKLATPLQQQEAVEAVSTPIENMETSSILQNSTVQPENIENGSSLVHDSIGEHLQFDLSSPVELHVLDNDIWNEASRILGQMIVAVIKSFLPLTLQDNVNIGWGDFIAQNLTSPSTSSDADSHVSSLWLKLDFGTTKRSTILKKLKLLQPSTVIALQLETYIVSNNIYSNTGTIVESNSNSTIKQKVVLMRLAPTVQHLITILANTDNNEEGNSAAGLLPITVLNIPSYSKAEQSFDKYDPANRVRNAVNSFHMIVSKIFFEIVIDFAMLLMVLLTMISPIRFMRLIYALLEPEKRFPLRIMQHVVSMIKYADMHLVNYRKAIYIPMNKIAKIIKCRYLGYDIITPEQFYYGDISKDAARFRYEMYKLGYKYFDPYITSIDEMHYYPYLSIVKNAKKVLSSTVGCNEMENLFNERLKKTTVRYN